jgi:hypothetical protein
MAFLYVAEFERPRNQWVTIANAPPIAEQTIAIGGASVACTNAFNAKTAMIRVETDSICSIAIGTAPTATTSTMRMNAGDCEYFSVSPNMKIAVISNT